MKKLRVNELSVECPFCYEGHIVQYKATDIEETANTQTFMFICECGAKLNVYQDYVSNINNGYATKKGILKDIEVIGDDFPICEQCKRPIFEEDEMYDDEVCINCVENEKDNEQDEKDYEKMVVSGCKSVLSNY